jgi:hypothetical protein
VIEPTGRGVLDTRFRGYDDFVRGDHLHVIARSGSDEAIHASASREVDCFAALAMTQMGRGVSDTPACVGYRALFGPHKILQPEAIGISPTLVTPM